MGAPQCSIVMPFLFTVCINGMMHCAREYGVNGVTYANNMVIYTASESIEMALLECQHARDNVNIIGRGVLNNNSLYSSNGHLWT